MATVVNLVNESKLLADKDAQALGVALKTFVSQVCHAWNINDVVVTQSPARVPSAWNVCIVDKFPNPAMGAIALGYHETLNGVPISYIRAGTYRTAPLGRFRKGLTVKGKIIRQDRYQEGTAAIVFHEVVEMLVDPLIGFYKTSPSGKSWVVEPADHVKGNYYRIDGGGVDVIAPDWTEPSFYDVNGKAPYSFMNIPTAPFTMTPQGYGYYKDATGLHKL